MKLLLLFAFSLGIALPLSSQPGAPASTESLPLVFILGTSPSQLDQLVAGSASLLEVFDNDIDRAYYPLRHLMLAMETQARKDNYPLNGVRFWVHLFWNPDGSIQHIGYYLKPNSLNVSPSEFSHFLTSFAKGYTAPVSSPVPFRLYTSFAFPVMPSSRPSPVTASGIR